MIVSRSGMSSASTFTSREWAPSSRSASASSTKAGELEDQLVADGDAGEEHTFELTPSPPLGEICETIGANCPA